MAYPGGGVSPPLPMLSHTYRMPRVGDNVLCLFFLLGDRNLGWCLGNYYDDAHPPFFQDPNIIGFDFFGEAQMWYDRKTRTFSIKADRILIDSTVEVTGDVKANEISLVTHTHPTPDGESGPPTP